MTQHEQPGKDVGLGSFLVGSILGSIVGAALALWFAPHSGQQTRQEIEQVAAETRRRIEGDSIEDAIQQGKAEARHFQETARR